VPVLDAALRLRVLRGAIGAVADIPIAVRARERIRDGADGTGRRGGDLGRSAAVQFLAVVTRVESRAPRALDGRIGLYRDAESEIRFAVSIGVVQRARVARVSARPTGVAPRPREIGVRRRASAAAAVIPGALAHFIPIRM